MAHIRQSRPDFGLGFQLKVRKPFSVVPSSLGSGPGRFCSRTVSKHGALSTSDRLRDLSGRGATRAEDAHGTPTQRLISPSILVYEEQLHWLDSSGALVELCVACHGLAWRRVRRLYDKASLRVAPLGWSACLAISGRKVNHLPWSRRGHLLSSHSP